MTRLFVVVEEESQFGTARSVREVSVELYDLERNPGSLVAIALEDARKEAREMIATRVNAGPRGPLP